MDILIVEDNKELLTLLTDFLRADGYTVSTADNGEKALSLYEKYGARLVLLDINLPGIDGFAVCEKIRQNGNTPVIMLTARVSKEDKLNGLILGADDYIEKPYDIDILLAKIKGIFKRRFAQDKIKEGDLELNLVTKAVTKNDKSIEMTSKEFELLKMLIENKGQTLTKDNLFNSIWGVDSESETQTLTVHIKWLREKIEADPKKPAHIITVWGKGYRWEE
ncbi:MAG: response regulator transcription factor [Acutalibacteraceae bacterium]|nr:response regulator transcription factor [Acutalibacteraceae bacterium]